MIAREARPDAASGRFARSLALLGMLVSATAAAQAPACKLLTDEHGLWPLPNCEVIDHRPKISADTLKALNYDDHGLAVVYADQGFHYVDRKGRSLPVLTWDTPGNAAGRPAARPRRQPRGLLRPDVPPGGARHLRFRMAVPGRRGRGLQWLPSWYAGCRWPHADGRRRVVPHRPFGSSGEVGFSAGLPPAPADAKARSKAALVFCELGGAVWVGRTRRKPIPGARWRHPWRQRSCPPTPPHPDSFPVTVGPSTLCVDRICQISNESGVRSVFRRKTDLTP